MKNAFNLSETSRRMMILVGYINAVILAAAAVISIFLPTFQFVPFLIGDVLGAFFAVVKLWLLERAIDQALDMSKDDAKGFMRGRYVLRLFVTGGALCAALLIPWIDFIGAVLGVCSLQLSAYAVNFIFLNKKSKGGE